MGKNWRADCVFLKQIHYKIKEFNRFDVGTKPTRAKKIQIVGNGVGSMKFDDVTQWVIAHRESPT